MKKLLFTFVLLLCSTRVMAQTCSSLSGACLKLTTSGVSENLGPIKYSSPPPFFQTKFWVGQDQVMGYCFSPQSFFLFRFHNGVGIATFMGSLAQNKLSGTVSKPGKADAPWSATFVPCPSQNFTACGQNCAANHCDPQDKPPCSPCYLKCLTACKQGLDDDPSCED